MHRGLILSLALAVCAPSWAINKCTMPNGKISFQDAPCPGKGEEIEVKPASGRAPAPAPAASDSVASAGAPPAKSGKKEGAFGDTWRRKTDLEQHLISSARNELNGHLQGCDRQQRELAAKKGHARNNLAGATWEQSISAEMQAAATTCDTKARDLRARLDSLERELRELSR